jgi:hypothetical protein
MAALAFADCALPLQIFSLCYRRANRARRSFKSIRISKMRISMPFWPLLLVRQFEGQRRITPSANPPYALSPARQIEFLKLMRRMEQSTICQIVMATHSPMLMAHPNARLLRLSKYGLEPVTVAQTDHYKVMREFCDDPAVFVEAAIAE